MRRWPLGEWCVLRVAFADCGFRALVFGFGSRRSRALGATLYPVYLGLNAETGLEVAALHTSGNWTNGTNCRSRSQNANNTRWNTNSNIGSRRHSDTGRSSQIPLAGFLNLVAKGETLDGKIPNGKAKVASRNAERHFRQKKL